MAVDRPASLLNRRGAALATSAAGCGVALQIAYPLVHGAARDRLTIAIVIVLAMACVMHAAASRGISPAAAALLGTALPGFAAEVVGVHTGLPFGSYSYAPTLGPHLFGVPLVVALAWTMLAWPAAIAARRLVSGSGARVLIGAWGLAAADLFLDPQLVADGHWRWRYPHPHLPGVAHVPLTNYAGWLLVAVVLSIVLQRVLDAADAGGNRDGAVRRGPGVDALPVALYLWLYTGWIVAQLAFLDLRAAALWGGLGMGAVAVPLAVRVLTPVTRR